MSSPKYVVRIRREVKAAIAGWRLPREMLVGVYKRLLTDLPAAPDRHLHDPITPPNLWAFHFTLGEEPSRHLFSFAVERRDYAGELHVFDARVDIEGS